MAFFLIVPSVMIVSILLVHALANRLGLRIYYPTLIAVAVVSIMVDFAAAALTPAVGRAYLFRLGLMILATSLLLTLANRFLLKRQQAEDKRFNEEVKAAYEAEKQKDLTEDNKKIATIDKFEWEDAETLFEAPPAYNKVSADDSSVDKNSSADDSTTDNKVSSVDNSSVDKKSSADDSTADNKVSSDDDLSLDKNSSVDDSSADNKVSADDSTADNKVSSVDNSSVDKKSSADDSTADNKVSSDDDLSLDKNSSVDDSSVDKKISAEARKELNAKSTLPKDFPLEKVFEPLHELKNEDADKPIKLVDKPKENDTFPLDEVFKPLSEVKREEVKTPPPKEKKSKRTEFFPLQEVFRPLSTLDLEKLEEITQEEKTSPHEDDTNPEEKIDTLDDLLDKAYIERDKGHVWQAIEIYKKALDRYRNDEYAPFVAIDLGNIYKDQALYSNAIKIYEEALMLPAVKRNSEIRKEFLSTLEYLRVVHNVLVKRRALSTPFNQLSKEILQEIDTEFQRVQINSAQ